MAYDFSTLGPADFEDLARELIGREMGIRFEAFAAGPDGGMDGRHAKGPDALILQAKHRRGSPFSSLKSTMSRERGAIDRLNPGRYLLATSRPLTPRNKEELAGIIGPALKEQSDIFGPEDLNGLLRKFPDIEKSHVKLWLSSTAVLEKVVRSAQHAYATITREEIEAKVRVYAQNPSFQESRNKLERHHVLIVSGPPGVGKTTLAEMLSYAYIGEGWELVPIRSLEDGFAHIDDTKKRIYFFDDFLGKISLDAKALSSRDTDLARFIRRIRTSPNARFVLTTRANIYEEARRASEALSDHSLDITKYVLDVGKYTRRIKARILYNHLLVAGTPKSYIRSLMEGDTLKKIVDHPNYNPRVIEWMTDAVRLTGVSPENYGKVFLTGLDEPHQLWDTAFRHLSKKCQHLLFALFFSSEYGVDNEDLRRSYDEIHPFLCKKYGEAHDPKDFNESLRILEGGFIALTGEHVRFVNPSVRDYLASYLDDQSMLRDFAAVCPSAEWAHNVWKHGTRHIGAPSERTRLARTFASSAPAFLTLPVYRPSRKPGHERMADIANVRRIELLLGWYSETLEPAFSELVLDLARAPVHGFSSWRDGEAIVELVGKLADPDYFGDQPHARELGDILEAALIELLEYGMASDDLESIADAAFSTDARLSPGVVGAVIRAIEREFEEVSEISAQIDSESTLEDHAKTLEKLAPRAGIPEGVVASALSTVRSRMEAIAEAVTAADAPAVTGSSASRYDDKFDDDALRSLFQPLAFDA